MRIQKFVSQNKQVIIVAASIFVVSLASILLFSPQLENEKASFLQTSVLHPETEHKEEPSQGQQAKERKEGSHDVATLTELLQDAENPYFTLDKDGKVKESSEAFAATLGRDYSATIGLFIFDFVEKDDQEKMFKDYRGALSEKKPQYKAGPYRITSLNEAKIVLLSFIPISENGEEILVELQDITEDLKNLKTAFSPENAVRF